MASNVEPTTQFSPRGLPSPDALPHGECSVSQSHLHSVISCSLSLLSHVSPYPLILNLEIDLILGGTAASNYGRLSVRLCDF